MKLKLPLKTMLLLCLFCMQAQAQTIVKATTTPTYSASGIDNLGNAVDVGTNYLSTAARLNSAVIALNAAANNKFVEIAFPEDVPANTPVYLKMTSDPENNVLGVLAGGAIGNLLTGVLNTVLIGNQTITVEGFTASGQTSIFSTNTFNSENYRVVFNSAGEHFVKITHTAAYRRLKITNTAIGGVTDNTKYLDVFGAYFVKTAASCASAAYTSYNAGGLLSVVDISVTNPGYAIDANNSTHSSLSLGVLGVGEWVEQTVYFEGSSSSTDSYNLKVSIPSALLAANLIGGITVRAYSGTSTTAVYTSNLSSLLGLPVNAQVLSLLQNNQPAILSVAPGVTVDRIALRYEALVAVNTNYNVFLYEVTKGFNVSVTGAGSFFTNANNVVLTANVTPVQCSATYTYSWTATGNSTVLGTSQTYSPPTATPGTYNYTVTVTDSYGVVKTASAQVIILAPPVAGSVNNVLLECTETSPVNLTLTGYTGSVVRWEKANNSGFTGATTIATTNAFLTPAQMGTVTTPTYFRAVVTQNGYPEVTSTGGAVTIKSSTWNGSAWSNGTPDIGTIIYFTGNYSQDTDLNGCRIYVNNGAVVTIPTNRTVHLAKSINVVSGSFTLQNEAHLLQDSATEPNTGNITVTRNGSNLYRLDYAIWSAPVTGQNLLAFSPATSTSPSRFYEYTYVQANNAELFMGVDAANTNFDVAKGYLIRMPNIDSTPGYNAGTTPITHVGLFTGVPNNGTITRTLNTQGNRYTAVGNPYPSPINVHDFFTANSNVLETGSALYFWRKKNNYYASSYATLTWDVYTYNHAVGGNPGEDQYGGQQWDDDFNTSDANNWTINTGQGFLVQTKETLANGVQPIVTFNAGMRRGNVHTNQFFRTMDTNEDLKSRIWLELQSPTYTTQAALVYSSTATLGLDYGRDAALLTDPAESYIWSKLDDHMLTIQARPQFTDTDVVPLGFDVTAAGDYTLALHRADGVFAEGQDVYLKDNLLGTITNLSEGAYSFSTGAGTFENRFEVVYQTEGAMGNSHQALENTVMVYQNNSAINITTGTAEITGITIYDVSGRKLYSQTGINATEATVTNLNAAQQVLLIEIETVKGTVSKKIVH